MNNEAANSRTLEESIAQYASKAALNTYGVHSLYGGLAGNITKNLLGRDSSTRGVKISQNEDHKVLADIHVIVKYGCKIPDVAWNLQENIKREIEASTDCKVEFVNIHVQGVHYGNEEASQHA